MSAESLFAPAPVIAGDNQVVRGMQVKCGRCANTARVAANALRAGGKGGVDIDRENAMISRKFANMGWKIAGKPTHHLCPSCFAKVRNAQKRKDDGPQLKIVQPEATTVENPKPVEDVRVLGIDDALLIAEKLRDVYSAKGGYVNGANDATVGVELGVPRAWVGEIRRKQFGQDAVGDNEEIRAKIEEATVILADIRKQVPDLQRLLIKADKIEETLIQLARALR